MELEQAAGLTKSILSNLGGAMRYLIVGIGILGLLIEIASVITHEDMLQCGAAGFC